MVLRVPQVGNLWSIRFHHSSRKGSSTKMHRNDTKDTDITRSGVYTNEIQFIPNCEELSVNSVGVKRKGHKLQENQGERRNSNLRKEPIK
ncbi:hypothetical protein AVEN_60097-1 [Araneus ventricosus]|uniref:Uncharacterized protein n=1 Tax=Araneus ventricosus TaxID=182803 RepID=A0A4Y2J8V3_ARAVE|nr:hypothetical protein AVEN_60097-1 [Araneus ventricosus]